MENITPDLKDKIVAEWKEIAKKYIDSESRKLIWAEFSRKIEKEYGLTAWQVWELVRGKKINRQEQGKWYNKRIGNLTIGHLLAVLSFGFSIICYLVQKESDSETAKILTYFLFSHTIGEWVGDKIYERFGGKYDYEERRQRSSLFIVICLIICVILITIFGNSETVGLICSSLFGFTTGEIIGFETRKLKTIGLE
jgi:hypothetical protein